MNCKNYNQFSVLKNWGIVLLFVLSFNQLFAQRYPFTNISVKDGLPQSSIFEIIQDQQGYIWMATEAGLCRYDGYTFKTYSIHSGIGAKFISDIGINDQNQLWVATMGKGISWFDGEKFHRIDQTLGLPSNQIRSMEFTTTGDMMLCTLDSGIVKLSKNKRPEIITFKNGELINHPWRIIRQKNGDMLSTGSDGLVKYNAKNKYQPELLYSTKTVLLNVFESDNGDIWAGGVSELIHIRNNKITDRSELLKTKDDGNVNVWDIFQIKGQSTTYISTSKGLLILKDSTYKWFTTANGLPYDHIRDCYQDNYGNFWVGTYGGGAAILDSKGLDHFDFSAEVVALPTFSLLDDQQGRIWLGTDSHGYFIFDGEQVHQHPDKRLNENFQSLSIALNPINKEVWIGGMGGNIFKIKDGKVIWTWFPPKTKKIVFIGMVMLPNGTAILTSQAGAYKMAIGDNEPTLIEEVPQEYLRSAFIDQDNYVWFLGDEGDLFRWKDGKTDSYTQKINPELHALDQGLYDPFHKIYWVCSDGGLIAFNEKGRYLLHSQNGLKSDSPWSITQDSTGRIWIGHEKGVECIDVDNHKITFIGYDQGFTPVETNSCAAMTDSKGDVWFGTISSASRVRIHEMKSDDRTGILRVQKVIANKKAIYTELYEDTVCPNITLNYDQNTINIEMVALCYSNAHDVRYSWILKNYDEEWITDNEHREALYTNLPPGYYEFHAKAIEPNGFETNEIIIKINIRRPFWHRPWFYMAEFTILAIFIFFSFRFSSNPHQNKLGSFMTLLTILIIFESLLIYLSTYINQFTGDVPVFQLVMNVILAATLNPLEHFIQKTMRKWAIKESRKKNTK